MIEAGSQNTLRASRRDPLGHGTKLCGAFPQRSGDPVGRDNHSDTVRLPMQPIHARQRAGLLAIARALDPLVLRWAK
jgi:hypothetical protein